MFRQSVRVIFLFLTTTLALAKGPAYTDPNKTDADFPYQGEYVGTAKTNNGDLKVGVQIIALGGGKFHSVGWLGGLPGDGWNKSPTRESDGELKNGTVVCTSERVITMVKDGKVILTTNSGNEFAKLDR